MGANGTCVLQAHCGDCGGIWTIGPGAEKPDEERRQRENARWPLCRGYFNGRPGNRCGWPLSYVWLWYPVEKAKELARER